MKMNNPCGVGYIGSKTYSLKYLMKTRNFRCTWPHNNVFSIAKDENTLLQDILSQSVGLKSCITGELEIGRCQELKRILQHFLECHRKTHYESILRNCTLKKGKKDIAPAKLCPLSRRTLKEFLHRLISNVIPIALFGSKENQIQFERNLRRIMKFGKSQVYTLEMVMTKITIKNVKYLKLFSNNFNKTNLIAKVFIWLLRVYIFAALKSVFYATENNYSNELLFYEKCIWQKIQQRCLNKMKKEVIRKYENFPVNSRTISSKNIFLLRVLPKFEGSRPVLFRWKNDDFSKYRAAHEVQIMKQTLYQTASIYFKMAQTSLDEFHNRWLNLYYAWLSLGKPMLYFIRIDFVDAFGSIDQKKLIEIIERSKAESELSVIEYRHQNKLKKINKDEAFRILRNYISHFVFKNNKYMYKLIRGICQGGPLSSALCNIYFAEINANYLIDHMNDPKGFFIQNCDDYLYITMNHANAVKFMNRMQEGFPDFNMLINSSKTKTNIYDASKYITDFGRFRIDVKSFQLYGCYTSYQGINTFYRSVFRSMKAPGKILQQRLLLFSTMKLDKVFFDDTYNTTFTIAYNIYLVAYLVAIRCVSLTKIIFTEYNLNYIYNCVQKCAIRLSKTVSSKLDQPILFDQSLLRWIVLKAFVVKFRQSGRGMNKLANKLYNYCSFLSNSFSDQQREEVFDKFQNELYPDVLTNVL